MGHKGTKSRHTKDMRVITHAEAIAGLVLCTTVAGVMQLRSAHAHHGVSAYDMNTVLTLEGVVEEWGWQQPHTSLMLRINRNDAAEVWEIEGAPPRWMDGQGWTPESLLAGEAVTITYHPVRGAGSGYAGILMEVERASGEVLKVNRPKRLGGP